MYGLKHYDEDERKEDVSAPEKLPACGKATINGK
jgi:hypothetical protein